MAYCDRDTLFLFLDESGNLDFSLKGTKYWSLTAFCTFHPSQGKESFLDLLYSLADAGKAVPHFHATEDRQAVRDEVFKLIRGLEDGHEVHSVIAEKRKAGRSLYRSTVQRRGRYIEINDESRFYEVVCKALLTYVFKCPRFAHARHVVIVLSSLFTKERHQTIKAALIRGLTQRTQVPFQIYFQENRCDINCQIADYCGWAITRKWELGDRRSYDLIQGRIRNEFDIFERGMNTYY